MDLSSLLRSVPDFPRPGVLFRDVCPLLAHPEGLREAVERVALPWRFEGLTKVAGVEARGLIFGAPVAIRLGVGFVPVRKPGKLPRERVSQAYDLEYGRETLEIHADAVSPGDRVLVVDDVLATGGTAAATVSLLRRGGATVVGVAVLLELTGLHGRDRLDGLRVTSAISLP